uniref:Kinase family protein n=1 Tax=Rhizophora mucronata TaxID=61149 RepID=A0A2P2JRS9_RHIMU
MSKETIEQHISSLSVYSFKALAACGSKDNHLVDQEVSCPHLLMCQSPPTWRPLHPSPGAYRG